MVAIYKTHFGTRPFESINQMSQYGERLKNIFIEISAYVLSYEYKLNINTFKHRNNKIG